MGRYGRGDRRRRIHAALLAQEALEGVSWDEALRHWSRADPEELEEVIATEN